MQHKNDTSVPSTKVTDRQTFPTPTATGKPTLTTKYYPFTLAPKKTSTSLTTRSANQSPSTKVIFTPAQVSMETTQTVSSYTVNTGTSTSREPSAITKQGTSSTKFQTSTLSSASTTKRPPVTLPPVSSMLLWVNSLFENQK